MTGTDNQQQPRQCEESKRLPNRIFRYKTLRNNIHP